MKDYKKVKMVAKNAPSGSYAAGCPKEFRERLVGNIRHTKGCKPCELAQ